MYHPRLSGAHYDMGLKCGRTIKKNSAHMKTKTDLREVTRLSKEKRKFGGKCIEVCREVFPEAVEELHGLSDGLGIPIGDFAGWIFCIYCYEYQRGCTCFVCNDGENIVLGRNSDFWVEIRDACESALYMPDGGYSFIGNSTAMVQMEDGYNEHGLAVGLTFIPPMVKKPGLNAGMLLRYMLEKCRTVKEAINALPRLPISSAQTFTLVDRTGEMAVVECNCEKTVVIRPGKNEHYLVSTNQFESPHMQRYEIMNFLDSRQRYEVARRALNENKNCTITLAEDILAGKFGFMCQYDRRLGFDTLWSTVYDLGKDRVFRAEGNPSRAEFREDTRLAWAKSRRVKA